LVEGLKKPEPMMSQQNEESPNLKDGSPWRFSNFARWIATASGKPATFAVALFIVIIWAGTGPIFGYSDTWQLVINTGTTIVTFLMVFLIQNTQNRDTQALQLKLDELIRVTKGASNRMLNLEEMDEAHLERLREIYERLASKAGSERERTGKSREQRQN
jgi:low affinity Fe/Cu permease